MCYEHDEARLILDFVFLTKSANQRKHFSHNNVRVAWTFLKGHIPPLRNKKVNHMNTYQNCRSTGRRGDQIQELPLNCPKTCCNDCRQKKIEIPHMLSWWKFSTQFTYPPLPHQTMLWGATKKLITWHTYQHCSGRRGLNSRTDIPYNSILPTLFSMIVDRGNRNPPNDELIKILNTFLQEIPPSLHLTLLHIKIPVPSVTY